MIELRIETLRYLILNKVNSLRFIRSTFKEPKSGKWTIGFKLVNKVPEFHSLSIYLTFADSLKYHISDVQNGPVE